MAGYISTDCRAGYHRDCHERQIVPDCACMCHDQEPADEVDTAVEG